MPRPLDTEDHFVTILMQDSRYTYSVRSLVSGALAIGFILSFTEKSWVLGALLGLPYISQLLQLPFLRISRRFRSNKQMATIAQLISRSFLLLMVLLPFLSRHPGLQLGVILISILGFSVGDAMFYAAWNPLIKATLAPEDYHSFLAKTLDLSWLAFLSVALCGGLMVQLWQFFVPQFKPLGYSIVWLIVLGWSFIGTYRLSNATAPLKAVQDGSDTDKLSLNSWLRPWRDQSFRPVLIYLIFWSFAIFLSTSFFSAYMLYMLHWPIGLVVLFTTLSQLTTWVSLRLIPKLKKRLDPQSLLIRTNPAYVFCILLWVITHLPGAQVLGFLIVLGIMLLFGLATSLTTLGNQQLALDHAPEQNTNLYLVLNSTLVSLASGTGALIGGLILDSVTNMAKKNTFPMKATLSPIQHVLSYFNTWDVVFIFSALVAFLSLIYLAKIPSTPKPIKLEQDFSVAEQLFDSKAQKCAANFH